MKRRANKEEAMVNLNLSLKRNTMKQDPRENTEKKNRKRQKMTDKFSL